jgi:hypothetical protein
MSSELTPGNKSKKQAGAASATACSSMTHDRVPVG